MKTTTSETPETKTCRTCCRPVYAPYRRQDAEGKVVEGCVAADHTGHVYGSLLEWHNRKEGKAARAMWTARARKH